MGQGDFYNHMLDYVGEQVGLPPQPKVYRQALRDIARMYAAVCGAAPATRAACACRQVAVDRLGPKNVERIEKIALAWQSGQPWPQFNPGSHIQAPAPGSYPLPSKPSVPSPHCLEPGCERGSPSQTQ